MLCDALHDLVPFVQFRKRENHPWRSVTFSKVAGATHRYDRGYSWKQIPAIIFLYQLLIHLQTFWSQKL